MLYGYSRRVINRYGLRELKEVTFQASPDDLRRIATFLTDAASQIEAGTAKTDHLHLSIEDAGWGKMHPEMDVVVSLPVAGDDSRNSRRKPR